MTLALFALVAGNKADRYTRRLNLVDYRSLVGVDDGWVKLGEL